MLHVAVLRGPSVIAFAKMMEDSPEIGGKRLSVDIVDSGTDAGIINKRESGPGCPSYD